MSISQDQKVLINLHLLIINVSNIIHVLASGVKLSKQILKMKNATDFPCQRYLVLVFLKYVCKINWNQNTTKHSGN